MAQHRLTPELLQELHDLAKQWGKIVSRHAFGDDGPDLDIDFDTMEQLAAAAAQGLAEGTVELLLARQAQKLGTEQPCPACGRSCPVGLEPRRLVARGATVVQAEPVCHCPACRRDFFPPAAAAAP